MRSRRCDARSGEGEPDTAKPTVYFWKRSSAKGYKRSTYVIVACFFLASFMHMGFSTRHTQNKDHASHSFNPSNEGSEASDVRETTIGHTRPELATLMKGDSHIHNANVSSHTTPAFMAPLKGSCTELEMKDPWKIYDMDSPATTYIRFDERRCEHLDMKWEKFLLRCLNPSETGWSFRATRHAPPLLDKDFMMNVLLEEQRDDKKIQVQRNLLKHFPNGWRLRAPFLLMTYDVFQVEDVPFFQAVEEKRKQVWYVTDLPATDLYAALHEELPASEDNSKKALPEKVVRIGAQIAYGLWEMHQRNIIHRNLNIENVMCVDTSCSRVMLGEFGNLLNMNNANPPEACFHEKEKREHVCGVDVYGSALYMSPNMFKLKHDTEGKKGYGFEVDWWAFGIVLYRMHTGSFPYDVEAYDDCDGQSDLLGVMADSECSTEMMDTIAAGPTPPIDKTWGALGNLLQLSMTAKTPWTIGTQEESQGEEVKDFESLSTPDARLKMMTKFSNVHEHPILGHEFWLSDTAFLRDLGMLEPDSEEFLEKNAEKRFSQFWGKVCLKFAADPYLCPAEARPSSSRIPIASIESDSAEDLLQPGPEKNCEGMEFCRTECELPRDKPQAQRSNVKGPSVLGLLIILTIWMYSYTTMDMP